MGLVDKLKKLPFDEAYDKASGLRKKAAKGVKKRVKKVKEEFHKADRAIFGGKGLRKNIRTVKKQIKSGGRESE